VELIPDSDIPSLAPTPIPRRVRESVESFLTDPKVVRRILTHLGLPSEAPAVKPARMLTEMGPLLDFGDDVAPAPEEDPWAELGTNEDERAPP
jgi:hypothetical protein